MNERLREEENDLAENCAYLSASCQHKIIKQSSIPAYARRERSFSALIYCVIRRQVDRQNQRQTDCHICTIKLNHKSDEIQQCLQRCRGSILPLKCHNCNRNVQVFQATCNHIPRYQCTPMVIKHKSNSTSVLLIACTIVSLFKTHLHGVCVCACD